MSVAGFGWTGGAQTAGMFDVGLGVPWTLLQQLGQGGQPAQDLHHLNGHAASAGGAAPSASNQRGFDSGGDSDDLPQSRGGRAKSSRSQSQGNASADYAVRHQAAEQRRRARINERLDALRKLVPHDARSNTASFLEEVIRYILTLKDSVEKLEHALVDAQQQPVQQTAPAVGSKRRAEDPPQPEQPSQLTMLQAQLQAQQQQQQQQQAQLQQQQQQQAAAAANFNAGNQLGQLQGGQQLAFSGTVLPGMGDGTNMLGQAQTADLSQASAASQALLALQNQRSNTPNLMPPPGTASSSSPMGRPAGGAGPPAGAGAGTMDAAALQQALNMGGANLAAAASQQNQQMNMLQLLLQLQQQQQLQQLAGQQLAGAQPLLLQGLASQAAMGTDPAMMQRLLAASMPGGMGGMAGVGPLDGRASPAGGLNTDTKQ